MILKDKITSKRTKVYDDLSQILYEMLYKERGRDREGREEDMMRIYQGKNDVAREGGRKAS